MADAFEPTDGLKVNSRGELLLGPERELRMRCVEAAALAYSGCQYAPAHVNVIALAKMMETQVLDG